MLYSAPYIINTHIQVLLGCFKLVYKVDPDIKCEAISSCQQTSCKLSLLSLIWMIDRLCNRHALTNRPSMLCAGARLTINWDLVPLHCQVVQSVRQA